jgi:hypothetical protein
MKFNTERYNYLRGLCKACYEQGQRDSCTNCEIRMNIKILEGLYRDTLTGLTDTNWVSACTL